MGTQSNALPNLPIFGFRSPHRVGGHGEFPALADDPELGGLRITGCVYLGYPGLIGLSNFCSQDTKKMMEPFFAQKKKDEAVAAELHLTLKIPPTIFDPSKS